MEFFITSIFGCAPDPLIISLLSEYSQLGRNIDPRSSCKYSKAFLAQIFVKDNTGHIE